MIGIAEMFAELDGYDRYREALEIVGAVAKSARREYWREYHLKRKKFDPAYRARRKAYDARRGPRAHQTDPAILEARRRSWREYKRRKAAERRAKEAA